MSAPTATGEATLSAECTVAKRRGYKDLHAECRQTEDVPLPHSNGLLLVRRCGCACHRRGDAS
jgi:hypothetical protein